MTTTRLDELYGRLDALNVLEAQLNQEISNIYSSHHNYQLMDTRAERLSNDLLRIKLDKEEVLQQIKDLRNSQFDQETKETV